VNASAPDPTPGNDVGAAGERGAGAAAPAGPARRRPSSPSRWQRSSIAKSLLDAWPRLDGEVYVVWCATAIAYVASVFVSSMLRQTQGVWSAPLDDVFIHFDYARSTARGHPFQWSEGNGYSSGNTSFTYPFVLAIGWLFGFRDPANAPTFQGKLMMWAVGVACVSMLVFFIAAARYVRPLGPWAKYLLPPAVLSLGALDWSLFSGMENAFHLGMWGAVSLSFDRLERAIRARRHVSLAAALLGTTGALLVLTRPESVVCVAAFAVAAFVRGRDLGRRWAVGLAGVTAGAPAAAMGALSCLNRLFTGEWAQAGAISKLALYHPYMTDRERLADWLSQLKYVAGRMVHYHFGDESLRFPGRHPYGYLLPLLALVPLAWPALRGRAALLLSQVVGWTLVVAMNGQVRWQNERYTMSGVAWLLLLSGMGVAALVSRFGETLRGRIAWGGRLAVASLAVLLFWDHQRPRMRDQIWFYSRASRNIRDQQIETGRILRQLEDPKPTRVLVGDAGAITYAADLPGLDLIGLGGYHDYPFARATRYGLGSSLELIERMPDTERPNYMAIYPGWWGELPSVFGRYVTEVPVFGNVICGGPSKVIYRADWTPFDRESAPRTLLDDEVVVSDVDVADLMSERARRYERPAGRGEISWRVLPDSKRKGKDLFDAGRMIERGERESFDAAFPAGGGRLILRTASVREVRVAVFVGGREMGVLEIAPSSTWSEPSISIPPGLPKIGRVELVAEEGDFVDYHVFVTGARP